MPATKTKRVRKAKVEQPALPLETVIAMLRECEAEYANILRIKIRTINQRGAFVRRLLGFRIDLPEKERNKITKHAEKIVKSIVKNKVPKVEDLDVYMRAEKFVLMQTAQLGPIKEHEANVKKSIERLVVQLPIWDAWAKDVRGVAELSLGRIIGQAGDLSNYDCPAKLWKRFGLAVINGEAQGKRTDKIKAAEHGYSPMRRAIIWNIGENFVKHGGKYRAIYDWRKEYEFPKCVEAYVKRTGKQPEKPPKAHANNRAKRYATKVFMRDLWCEWNGKEPSGDGGFMDKV